MKYQSKFWNNYFKYYDVLLEVIPYQELLQIIADKLEVQENDKVLDIGAGTGNIRYFLPTNIQYFGIDNSIEALNRLNEKFPNSNTTLSSITDKLPFEDNTFDKIISNNVLYTLNEKDWEFIIKEINRVCKDDGIVVVSNLNSNFSPMTIYKEHIRKKMKLGFLKGFFHLLRLIYPTIQMFRYNATILKNQDIGNYSFIQNDEQKIRFEIGSFISKHDTILVYAKQAKLNTFIKRSF